MENAGESYGESYRTDAEFARASVQLHADRGIQPPRASERANGRADEGASELASATSVRSDLALRKHPRARFLLRPRLFFARPKRGRRNRILFLNPAMQRSISRLSLPFPTRRGEHSDISLLARATRAS